MRAIFFLLLSIIAFTSCEIGDSKAEQVKNTEIKRINSKLVKLESKLRGFDIHHDLNEAYYDSLARVYFEVVKHDKNLVGFYLGTPFNTYHSKNFRAWAVDAEQEEIFTDSTLFKFMRRADVFHSGSARNPNKVSVRAGVHTNYQKTTQDVMYVNYALEKEMIDLQLFYNLSKPYPAKFKNGNYGTSGSMVMRGEYILLK